MLSSLDWQKYDARVQRLERRLEQLLSSPSYSTDDRKLARVYVGLLGLVKDRLDAAGRKCLSLAEEYLETGRFPEELEGVSARVGAHSQQLALAEAKKNVQTDQPFLYQLLESSIRRRFSVSPTTDAELLAWMAAIGVPVEDIARVVLSVYPELERSWRDES